MLRVVLSVVLALFIFAAPLMAGEATVVSYDKNKLVVKVGDKEQTIEAKGVKFLDAEGVAVKNKDRPTAFKKDLKVELVEKDGKVVEVKIKK